jgi:hypothetical protein
VTTTRGGLLRLYLLATLLGGAGGAIGSILGNAGGRVGLFAGGLSGGAVLSLVAAVIASRRGWIPATRFRGAAVGAVLGFLLAASVAVNTLSSPVGPLLSPLLIGAGAVVGTVYGA